MCEKCKEEELLKARLNINKPDLSPYKSINQQVDKIEKYSHEVTTILFNNVSKVLGLKPLRKSHEDAPLIFKGQIQYNPRTHKPIKESEWKKLEAAIIKYLGIESNEIKRKVVKDSMWLGSILSRMSPQKTFNKDLKTIDLSEPDFKSVGFKDYDYDEIKIAENLSGQYLTDISERTRSKINQIITNGTRQKKAKHEVFQDLWDETDVINRDWDRVIRTETAMNANNGMLTTTLRDSGEDHTFMIGISSPDACPYCLKLVSDKIVVLLESAPANGNEKVVIDGKEYIAIWPGKSNYGRKPINYWTATTIHPYCRCGWSEFDPELEEYLKENKDKLF